MSSNAPESRKTTEDQEIIPASNKRVIFELVDHTLNAFNWLTHFGRMPKKEAEEQAAEELGKEIDRRNRRG